MVSLIDGQKSDAIDAITTTADTTRSSLSAAEKRYRGTAAALQTFAVELAPIQARAPRGGGRGGGSHLPRAAARAPSLAQIARIAADSALAGNVKLGLQLAPGLIDTDFSAASLADHPDLLARLSFVKAEYNSLELDAHLRALGHPLTLLVGRHGQNLIDYLRIGCVGVIPGTEMTVALGAIIRDWHAGREAEAIAAHGVVAPYVDFAMQDLDTVIDVGRAVMARVLKVEEGARRRPSGRDAAAMRRAVDAWFPYWQARIECAPAA